MASTPDNLLPFPLRASPRRFWKAFTGVVLTLVLILVGLGALLAWAWRPSGDLRSLRAAVRSTAAGAWRPELELSVGRLPAWCARSALGWVELPPEARAAVNAVRSAAVGIYRRPATEATPATAPLEMLRQVETTLKERGWSPVVTVREGDRTIAVLTRGESGDGESPLAACALVMEDARLILVAGDLQLTPLLELGIERGVRWDLALE